MKKKVIVTSLMLIVSLFIVHVCQAGLINYQRRNKQYGGGGSAATPSTPLAQWMQKLPSVRNRYERRYDINRDGKLQTAEVKIFLRDVLREIEAKGGFLVNSDVLKEYDKNSDGIISREEGKLLRKHVY